MQAAVSHMFFEWYAFQNECPLQVPLHYAKDSVFVAESSSSCLWQPWIERLCVGGGVCMLLCLGLSTFLASAHLKLMVASILQHAGTQCGDAVGPNSGVQPGGHCRGSSASAEEPLARQDSAAAAPLTAAAGRATHSCPVRAACQPGCAY